MKTPVSLLKSTKGIVLTFFIFNFFLLQFHTTRAQPVIQLDRTYGGASCDVSVTLRQMPDKGYIIVGTTTSFGAGGSDIWLVRTNVDGDTLWTKTYGGTGNDRIQWAMNDNMQITSDGGFVFVGSTTSYGSGSEDAWLIKTDANGDTFYGHGFFGGASQDVGKCVSQTMDGGFVFTGLTYTLTPSSMTYF